MDSYVQPSPCAHPGIQLVPHKRPDSPFVVERYVSIRARTFWRNDMEEAAPDAVRTHSTGLLAGVGCCGAEKRMAFMAK